MKLEERLTALRKEKGLSQLELAEALGVSRQAVSRWEVGASAPGMENLLALSRLYGVPLDELVGGPARAAEPEAEPNARAAELVCARRLNRALAAALAAVLLAAALLAAVLLAAALLAWLYWGRHSAPPADRTEEGIPIIDIEDMEGERIDDSDVVIIGETS